MDADFDQRRQGAQEVVVHIRGQSYTAGRRSDRADCVTSGWGTGASASSTPSAGPAVRVSAMADNVIGLVRRCGAATTQWLWSVDHGYDGFK